MQTAPEQTTADWFDANSSRRENVTLRVQDGQLRIETASGMRIVPLSDIRAAPRIGDVPHQLHLPDGVMISVADNTFVDMMFPACSSSGWMHKAERHWRWLLVLSVLALVLSAMVYRTGLPWAAAQLTEHIPEPYVQEISTEVYAHLQGERILTPSTLPPQQRERAERLFEEIAAPGLYLKVHRYSSWNDISLANAFAFPDGMIVLTDALLLILSDDELHAVLAHEAGHVHYRHGLRLMLQALGISAFVFFITGDISGISFSLLPVVLANMHYSREFEREADCYAAAHLRARGKSPGLIAAALRKIEVADEVANEEAILDDLPKMPAEQEAAQSEPTEQQEKDKPDLVWRQLAQLLSTHPDTEERANIEEMCS